jgi:choline dehydrogenase-like flavoprotein
LQANKILFGRKTIILALLKLQYSFLFKSIIPYFFSALKGAHLVDDLVIRVVADQSINQSNKMKVIDFEDGFFHVNLTLKIEERVISDAYAVVEDFVELVSRSKIVQRIYMYDKDKIAWDDPAHYFGTTPIGLYNYSSSLTSDSESSLYPRLYIIGNSSFPVGSHGHPTLLGMQLAMIVASKIVLNVKGE